MPVRLGMLSLVLLAPVGACDPGYRLVNADGPARGSVVQYSRAGYDLEAPAELHGLAGESWLDPEFALSRFSDTVRVEAAWLSAEGRQYQPSGPRPTA